MSTLGEQPAKSMHAYTPIRDYAVIGDCHGAALVSRHGSLDWCCLGRFDAEPIFRRILDADRGGFLSTGPEAAAYDVTRAYLPESNILHTTFTTREGMVAVTDFMPVGRAPGSGVHDYVSLAAPLAVVRIVEGLAGTTRVRTRFRTSVDFGRGRARLTACEGGVALEGGPTLSSDFELTAGDGLAEGVVDLRAGERRHILLSADRLGDRDVPLAQRAERLLQITRSFWDEWAAYCRYLGPYRDPVLRSALALKLLTFAPTGAIVAAPTTSLPERIDGERNWDYRYCWLRDATFTLYSLAALGYSGEARRFSGFLEQACRATHPRLQIMYGIRGETDLRERELGHLEGYCGSRPVRVGNAAFGQRQLDVYGSVLDWAFLHRTLGGKLDRSRRKFLASLADFVAAHWQEPDQGIWETRGPPRQHVYGKIMSWVALDRAVRMFGRRGELVELREAIRRSVLEQGRDPARSYLWQSFGASATDAALLLTPMVGFPADRRTLDATIETVKRELSRGEYLKRYNGDDGVLGEEGAFLITSFWLVDALLLADRFEEARGLFERLLSRSNDVGLYAEEIDPATHEFLGNFPQAFTHLALIQCATNLALYEERGAAALQGTHADRARYTVEATAGLRAVWAAFRRSGRVGRLWSSRASILPRGWEAGATDQTRDGGASNAL